MARSFSQNLFGARAMHVLARSKNFEGSGRRDGLPISFIFPALSSLAGGRPERSRPRITSPRLSPKARYCGKNDRSVEHVGLRRNQIIPDGLKVQPADVVAPHVLAAIA